jgi:flagellar motor switch protein FliN/FliY
VNEKTMKSASQVDLDTAKAGVKPAAKADASTPTIEPSAPLLVSLNDAVFQNVRVELLASLGRVELSVEDLLALRSGSILKLDLKMNDLIELRLNQSLVARGEIVAVDENFGVRIVEIARSS